MPGSTRSNGRRNVLGKCLVFLPMLCLWLRDGSHEFASFLVPFPSLSLMKKIFSIDHGHH